MTEKFVASNGVRVGITPAGSVEVDGTCFPVGLSVKQSDALREFFLADRDEELGRWRWPENPDYVVYPHPDGDFARVVSEVSGDSIGIYLDAERHTGSNFERAAVAYFAAHPDPKPWHDAKPGEVWALTVRGVEEPWVAQEGVFCDTDRLSILMPLNTSIITAGRRIWPEG